jgi:hypothetical protein
MFPPTVPDFLIRTLATEFAALARTGWVEAPSANSLMLTIAPMWLSLNSRNSVIEDSEIT